MRTMAAVLAVLNVGVALLPPRWSIATAGSLLVATFFAFEWWSLRKERRP